MKVTTDQWLMPCVEDVIINSKLHKTSSVKKAFANEQKRTTTQLVIHW